MSLLTEGKLGSMTSKDLFQHKAFYDSMILIFWVGNTKARLSIMSCKASEVLQVTFWTLTTL